MNILFKKNIFYLFIFILSIEILLSEENELIDFENLSKRIANASRINGEITIDGKISETLWDEAKPINNFIQIWPKNFEKIKDETEAYILYDDKNIYVAVKSFFKDIDKLQKGLARRDTWDAVNAADNVWVAFDSQDDGLNSNYFMVTASGIQFDGAMSKDIVNDPAWDAVWKSEVSIHENRWELEMSIPLSLLNFKNIKEQTWGLQIWRTSHYNQQWDNWPGHDQLTPGDVSRSGILKGIQNISSQRTKEFQPYILSGTINDENNSSINNVGIDFSYQLSPNSQVNTTINPDFGQVEADPSVLNLTAFETFVQEKRPFFVKGASFFNEGAEFQADWVLDGEGSFITKPIMLFNSRRIGRVPQAFDISNGEIIEKPMQTSILGAAKIFGKTKNNISYGFMSSITAEEFAVIEISDDNSSYKKRELLEPSTYYTLGRIESPIINNLSTLGFMITRVDPDNLFSETVGALDWRFKFLENKFTFAGQLINSNTSVGNGFGGRFDLRYDNTKWFDIWFQGGQYDELFDINRFGYLTRSDVKGYLTKLGFKRNKKLFNITEFNRIDLSYFNYLKNNNLSLIENYQVQYKFNILNFPIFRILDFAFVYGQSLESFDDRDTFRDDHALILKRPAGTMSSFQFGTATNLKASINLMFSNYKYDTGTKQNNLNLVFVVRPSNSLFLSVNPFYSEILNNEQWVEALDEVGVKKLIYSNSKQNISSLTFRMDYLFNPKLSFQAYYQPFEADVNYENFKYLLEDRTLNFSQINYDKNPNFISRTSRGTFVFRWEYLPGSRLFLVYNLNESNFFTDNEGNWEKTKTNSVFLKLDYFIRN